MILDQLLRVRKSLLYHMIDFAINNKLGRCAKIIREHAAKSIQHVWLKKHPRQCQHCILLQSQLDLARLAVHQLSQELIQRVSITESSQTLQSKEPITPGNVSQKMLLKEIRSNPKHNLKPYVRVTPTTSPRDLGSQLAKAVMARRKTIAVDSPESCS